MTTVSPYFLVFSNLFYFVPIAVLIYKSKGNKTHFIQEISLFILVWIASSLHHSCDTSAINKCYRSKAILYAFDLYFSYVAITGTFSAFYTGDLGKFYMSYVFIAPLLIVCFYMDSYVGAIILVAITTVCFIASQFSYALQHRFQFISYLCAILMIAGAVLFKLQGDKPNEDIQNYIIFHSLWHSVSALSGAVLLTALPHIDVLTQKELENAVKNQPEGYEEMKLKQPNYEMQRLSVFSHDGVI